jgi:hypothetical protein
MSPATFRLAVALSLVLGIASAAFEYFADARLPPPLSESISKLDESVPLWRLTIAVIAGVASILMGLVSAFGLYFFKSWAPSLAINSSLLAGLTLLQIPLTITHGASEALNMYSMILWGAAIAFSKSDSYRSRSAIAPAEA